MDVSSVTKEYLVGSTVVVGVVLILINSLLFSKSSKSKCTVAPTSFITNILALAGNQCPFFLLDMMRKLKCDIFKLKLISAMGGDWYIVADVDAVRTCLLDKNSEKPTPIYKPLSQVIGGDSMITMGNKHPDWLKARKGMSPAFSTSEVRRMNNVCKTCLESWIEERLEPLIESKGTFDPSREMTYLTFKIIMSSAFEYDNPTIEEFNLYSECIKLTSIEFDFENPFRVWFGLLIPARRRAFQAQRDMRVFCQKLLNNYRNNPNKSENNTVIKLVENLDFPEYRKISEMVILVVAGHDTTGYQLASTLMLLSNHPEEAEKLKNDILSAQMEQDNKVPGTGSQYLKHVIQESHRLMPTVATGVARHAAKDLVFKNGEVVIPKNSVLFCPFMLLGRNEQYFDDPDQFKPSRWENPTQEMKNAVIPFAIGIRGCLGQRLANAELGCALAILMSKYKFEVVDQGKEDFFLTLKYSGAKLRPSRA